MLGRKKKEPAGWGCLQIEWYVRLYSEPRWPAGCCCRVCGRWRRRWPELVWLVYAGLPLIRRSPEAGVAQTKVPSEEKWNDRPGCPAHGRPGTLGKWAASHSFASE